MSPASQQASDTAVAGRFTRPPFLYLACLVLGFALDRLLPLPLTPPEVTLICWTAGGGLILIGVAIMAAGIRNFSRAATPVPYTAGAAIRSTSACVYSMPASA